MASEEGGTEIEEVAEKTPEKIFKEYIDPAVGLQGFQARRIAFNINIPKELVGQAVKFMMGLYRAFIEKIALSLRLTHLLQQAKVKLWH